MEITLFCVSWDRNIGLADRSSDRPLPDRDTGTSRVGSEGVPDFLPLSDGYERAM